MATGGGEGVLGERCVQGCCDVDLSGCGGEKGKGEDELWGARSIGAAMRGRSGLTSLESILVLDIRQIR